MPTLITTINCPDNIALWDSWLTRDPEEFTYLIELHRANCPVCQENERIVRAQMAERAASLMRGAAEVLKRRWEAYQGRYS